MAGARWLGLGGVPSALAASALGCACAWSCLHVEERTSRRRDEVWGGGGGGTELSSEDERVCSQTQLDLRISFLDKKCARKASKDRRVLAGSQQSEGN